MHIKSKKRGCVYIYTGTYMKSLSLSHTQRHTNSEQSLIYQENKNKSFQLILIFCIRFLEFQQPLNELRFLATPLLMANSVPLNLSKAH